MANIKILFIENKDTAKQLTVFLNTMNECCIKVGFDINHYKQHDYIALNYEDLLALIKELKIIVKKLPH